MCYVSCMSLQKDSFHLYLTRILYSSPLRQNPYAFDQSSFIKFHQQDDKALYLFCALSRATTITHRKWWIMGKYNVTLAGTLLTFLFSPISSSSIFLSFRLYHDVPETRHSSNMTSLLRNNMQSFQHAWIFSTFNPNGQTFFWFGTCFEATRWRLEANCSKNVIIH
jgi:hypothetical protein